MVAISSDLTTTDSAFTTSIDTSYMMSQAIQTLVKFQPGTSTLMPELAKDWSVSADGLTYTFNLQDGVTFHDGTAMDATAVCDNFNRWINFTGADASSNYSYYVGAIFGGYGSDANFVSCAAPTLSQAVVTLKKPIASFLDALTLPDFGINSPTAMTKLDANNADPHTAPYGTGAPGSMNGTGPFMFKEDVKGDHVTFIRNPNYWDESNPPYLDSMTFKIISDPTAVANALQAGDVDLAIGINPTDIPTLQADSSLSVTPRGESCSTFFLGLNNADAPLDNVNVRQAINYAIDKQQLVDTFYGGATYATPATSWLPSLVPGEKDVVPGFNLDQAKSLLASSGLSSSQPLSLDFWYPSGVFRAYMPDAKGIFQMLQTDLQNAGFTVNPQTVPWGDYLDGVYGGKYPVSIIGWPCDYPTADNFLDTGMFFYSGGNPNPQFNYKNDSVHDLMVQAESAADASTALPIWGQVQDQLAQDMPMVPLVHAITVGAHKNYVENYQPSSNYVEPLGSIWLNK